ncbi:MAG: hypothetical protein HRU37_14500, partial [Roseibacillus sp.]|nr:hypothetical protein [Roseibacillus sp.]
MIPKMSGLTRVLAVLLAAGSAWSAPELIPQRMLPSESRKGDHPGRAVAVRICQTCHVFPEPDLLTKDFWNYYVLDEMGLRLGMTPGPEFKGKPHLQMLVEKGMTHVLEQTKAAAIYPEEPQLSTNDWAAIRQFYLDEAPDHLPPLARPIRLFDGLSQFTLVNPGLNLDGPMVSLIQIDERRRNIRLFDARTKQLFLVAGSDGSLVKIPAPGVVKLWS